MNCLISIKLFWVWKKSYFRLLVRTCLLANLWNVISGRPSTVPIHLTAKYAPAAMAESTEEKVHNCKL